MAVNETAKKPFRVGDGTPGPGRPKGSLNRESVHAKQAFQLAFDKLGGPDALALWALENQTDFYKLFSKLIPQDVTATIKPPEEALKDLA